MRPIFEQSYHWQTDAACRAVDPNLFFGPQHEPREVKAAREARAKTVCATCPVRQPCLEFAISTNEPFGVWGGLNELERRRLSRRAG
jgi:WhiB family redox-sensing transcriptional regulator